MFLLRAYLAFLASFTQSELARQAVFLLEERRILRSRLPKRIITSTVERSRLVKLGRELRNKHKEVISLVGFMTRICFQSGLTVSRLS